MTVTNKFNSLLTRIKKFMADAFTILRLPDTTSRIHHQPVPPSRCSVATSPHGNDNNPESTERHLTWSQNWFSVLEPSPVAFVLLLGRTFAFRSLCLVLVSIFERSSERKRFLAAICVGPAFCNAGRRLPARRNPLPSNCLPGAPTLIGTDHIIFIFPVGICGDTASAVSDVVISANVKNPHLCRIKLDVH